MNIKDLKMGDMFLSEDKDALIIITQSNSGKENGLMIVDRSFAFFLDPEKDKDSLVIWAKELDGLEKMSMRTVYSNLIGPEKE